MFELEKAFDTLQLVAAGTKKIAETPLFEKAEGGQLHAVKRLVRPKDGSKPYYRTYWLADHNEAYSARHHVNSLTSAEKEVERKKKELDRQPDYDWRKEDYDKAKANHERIQGEVDALETKAVKIEDKKFSTKTGVPSYHDKQQRIKQIDAEVEQINKEWRAWNESGPKKVREQTAADYQQVWKDAGLEVVPQGDFRLQVNDGEGKEMITLQHDMSWHMREDSKPTFEMRMRHSSFKTSDPEDFKKFGEMTEALAKIHAVTGDPAKMEKMAQLRKSYNEAENNAHYKNDFNTKTEELQKEKRQLEVEVKNAKIDDTIKELGIEPFELKEDYRMGEGRRSSSYRFARVIKQTPKQVVVGFSDSAAEGSFYQQKTMSIGDFNKFVEGHVDLDIHSPEYNNEVKGVAVEADEHKDTAAKLDVTPEKLGKMINDDHKKEVAAEKPKAKVPEKKPAKDSNPPAAPKKDSAASGDKKVVGHDSFDHPSGSKINKGDKVTFDHKGEQKNGAVIRTNVYQRFSNPYVLMQGEDGKKYEIVIGKVNASK